MQNAAACPAVGWTDLAQNLQLAARVKNVDWMKVSAEREFWSVFPRFIFITWPPCLSTRHALVSRMRIYRGDRTELKQWEQTARQTLTGLRHPSFEEWCRKAWLGVWGGVGGGGGPRMISLWNAMQTGRAARPKPIFEKSVSDLTLGTKGVAEITKAWLNGVC